MVIMELKMGLTILTLVSLLLLKIGHEKLMGELPQNQDIVPAAILIDEVLNQ
jgi:hypothetical protein